MSKRPSLLNTLGFLSLDKTTDDGITSKSKFSQKLKTRTKTDEISYHSNLTKADANSTIYTDNNSTIYNDNSSISPSLMEELAQSTNKLNNSETDRSKDTLSTTVYTEDLLKSEDKVTIGKDQVSIKNDKTPLEIIDSMFKIISNKKSDKNNDILLECLILLKSKLIKKVDDNINEDNVSININEDDITLNKDNEDENDKLTLNKQNSTTISPISEMTNISKFSKIGGSIKKRPIVMKHKI